MKKISILLSVTLMLLLACGTSQKEEEKQKKIDDSLMEQDRNAALDNANKLLADTSSTKSDTTTQADIKKK